MLKKNALKGKAWNINFIPVFPGGAVKVSLLSKTVYSLHRFLVKEEQFYLPYLSIGI